MSLAAAGAAFLNDTLKAAAGVTVTYRQKTGGIPVGGFPVTAVTGQEARDVTTQPAGAARVTNRERDYLIVLADLIAGSGETVTLPAEGDRIEEAINGQTVVFEVGKRNGEPCWRWSDRERTRVRVHTKQVTA